MLNEAEVPSEDIVGMSLLAIVLGLLLCLHLNQLNLVKNCH